MLLPDVNVFVYAYREDTPDHEVCREWLQKQLNAEPVFGISDLILSGFLRVVSHPRIFSPPTPVTEALQFVSPIKAADNVVAVRPGSRHWQIFTGLLSSATARGNLVPDAWFAALAIEHACTWVTADRGFGRFPGLDWQSPLDS